MVKLTSIITAAYFFGASAGGLGAIKSTLDARDNLKEFYESGSIYRENPLNSRPYKNALKDMSAGIIGGSLAAYFLALGIREVNKKKEDKD